MDVATLARAQAANRVAVGTGLMLAPSAFARVWAGGAARDARARPLARGLGARDLLLGLAAVVALRESDTAWARRAFAAHALADAVDLLAIAGAGERLPRASRLVGTTLAGASAAVAAAYAARLGQTPP